MDKIPYVSQNTEVKTLSADVCIFGHFGRLSLPSVYSADCRFVSGVKQWIYVSSIVTYLRKNSIFVALKQLQTTLWIVDALLFLIDCEQMRHLLWTQLSHWQMFMQNDEYTAFWYLQLLCYLTQLIYDGPKRVCAGFFFCFVLFCLLRQLPNLGDLSVQHHLCLYNHV